VSLSSVPLAGCRDASRIYQNVNDLMEPVDASAVDQGWKFSSSHTKSVANWREAENHLKLKKHTSLLKEGQSFVILQNSMFFKVCQRLCAYLRLSKKQINYKLNHLFSNSSYLRLGELAIIG
jgi:hypothetical protein